MTIQQKEKCGEILKHYGFNNQREILMEECAELIQAVSKLIRNDAKTSDNYIEELADVSIMLEQMKQALSDTEKQAYTNVINRKLERQINRMRGGLELNCNNCGRECDSRAGANKFCGNYQPKKGV